MSKNTFKIGDQVRRINCDNGASGLKVGETDVVTGYDYNDYVATSKYPKRGNAPWNLELVEAKKTFKVGDRVRVNAGVSEGWFFGAGDVAIVTEVDTNTSRDLPISLNFLGRRGTGHVAPEMIDLIPKVLAAGSAPAPKGSPIKSVKVDRQAIHDALTAFVKDTLGIDASVTKIVGSYEKAVELVLAEEAR